MPHWPAPVVLWLSPSACMPHFLVHASLCLSKALACMWAPSRTTATPLNLPLQLTREQLCKLLLCTAMYTGAGSVLLDGLGLKPADLQPLGGAGLAPEVAQHLVSSCSSGKAARLVTLSSAACLG